MHNYRTVLFILFLVTVVSSSALWRLIVNTQTEQNDVSIGVIALTDVDNETFRGFKDGMAKLGYIEGNNVTYVTEGPAGTIDKLDGIIGRVLEQDIDLFFVSSTPATLSVKKVTQEGQIPVIFAPVNDPVGAGIVKSLKRPGGNITGIKLSPGDGLRLSWLKTLVPSARKIYFPYNPIDKSALASLKEVEDALSLLSLEMHTAPFETPDGIPAALAKLPRDIDAIFLPRDSSIESKITQIIEVAHSKRLPVSAPSLVQVEAGALYTYGFIHYEFGRQAARLAHQVINGVSPADIPVEVANNYLAINVTAAKKIGLELSNDTLRKADKIIRLESHNQ